MVNRGYDVAEGHFENREVIAIVDAQGGFWERPDPLERDPSERLSELLHYLMDAGDADATARLATAQLALKNREEELAVLKASYEKKIREANCEIVNAESEYHFEEAKLNRKRDEAVSLILKCRAEQAAEKAAVAEKGDSQ